MIIYFYDIYLDFCIFYCNIKTLNQLGVCDYYYGRYQYGNTLLIISTSIKWHEIRRRDFVH